MWILLSAWAVSPPAPTTSVVAQVVGGEPTGPGVWPDAVALYSGTTLICSGTLIAPDVVLTAGHCTPGVSHVVLNASDLSQDGETIGVVEQIAYPDALTSLDVAIVRLETASPIPPRPLALDCLGDFIVAGATATVAGFGRTDRNGTEETLLLHDVELPITDSQCEDLSRGCREPGAELIAGGDGIDSCSGDSGGPLYLDTPRGTVLAGVVARGAFPSTTTCGDGGIYVRTDAIAEWIEETASITLPLPDCTGLNRPPQLSAPRLELSQGQSAPLGIVVDDPDSTRHHFDVVLPPERGWVDANMVFHAEPFQLGPDRVIVEVTDNGSPARSATIEIPIGVFPAGVLDDPVVSTKGGCTVGGGPSALSLLGSAFGRR